MMRLQGRSFPVEQAWFRRESDDAGVRPCWTFDIRTAPPLEEEASDDIYAGRGLRLYTEAAALPLEDGGDLTGTELILEAPFDPDSGDPYFTLYVYAHLDVGGLRLAFLERDGDRYRIRMRGEVHGLYREPVSFTVDTWIRRVEGPA